MVDVEVGMGVQWFPQGTKANSPRGGIVIEVGTCGMVTIALPTLNGGNEIKPMVRHITDPVLEKHRHIGMEGGAWDFTAHHRATLQLFDLLGATEKKDNPKKTEKKAELV